MNEEKSVLPEFSAIPAFNKLLRRDILVIIAVFSSLVLLSITLVTNEIIFTIREKRIEASNLSILYGSEIERIVGQTFMLNSTVASLVILDEEDLQEDFDNVASKLLPDFPMADCVQLAPDGIVKQIYPLAGNEQAMGHNLFEDENRIDEALATRNARKLLIGGPYNLKQGGTGFIGRLPVYMDINGDSAEDFWGFVNVVLTFATIEKFIDLSALSEQGYAYRLSRISDEGESQLITSQGIEYIKNPEVWNMDIYNMKWELAVYPVSGWSDLRVVIIIAVLCIILIVSLTTLVKVNIQLRNNNLKLSQLASLDQLTNLYSKHTAMFALKKEIGYAKRNCTQVAVCFIDMNNFKAINDNFGHSAGDAALVKVAKRLQESVRPEDIVSRFGGDEFMIVLRGKYNGTDYSSAVERIESVLKIPARINAHTQVDISAAVGIAVYPFDGEDVDALVQAADKAMYEVKKKMHEEDL